MATRTVISKAQQISALAKCATKYNKEKLTLEFPENFSQDDYWNKLAEISKKELDEDQITAKRRPVCETFEELKFLRSTFNVVNENGDHISSIWDRSEDQMIKDAVAKVDKDTITGAELSRLIKSALGNKKKDKRFELWKDDNDSMNKLQDFIETEAYASFNPRELFYPDGAGRGRKSVLDAINSFEL